MSRSSRLAAIYDALLGPLERWRLGEWRRRVWAEVPSAGRGLEIGAGSGANFDHHPPRNPPIATDLSPKMLDRALRRHPRQPRGLVAADVLALPFADSEFDWVVETLVFCEVADPVAGLREVGRVLLPGGRLVMLEHVRPSGWLGRVADLATLCTAPLLGEHFDRDAESAVLDAGFRVVKRQWLWRDALVLLVCANVER